MRQIVPGVFYFSRASIYQYILVDETNITLIDAGLSIFGESLKNDLQKTLPERLLQFILITHADGDHFGAAGRIRQAFNSKIASSASEADAIRSGWMSRDLRPRFFMERLIIKAFLPIFNTPPTQVDITLEPGQILPILNGLHVLDTAGHTPGHLSFYLPEQRVLFAGDSIVKRNKVPSPAYGINCWDESLAQQAFDRQMALKPIHLCCGHSYFNLKSQVV